MALSDLIYVATTKAMADFSGIHRATPAIVRVVFASAHKAQWSRRQREVISFQGRQFLQLTWPLLVIKGIATSRGANTEPKKRPTSAF